MRTESLLDQCLCAPGSFAGLMAIYEQNYGYLAELLGDLARLPRQALSRLPGHLPLRLTVLERFPYTTTVSLTYLFRDSGVPQTDPDILVRLYHDAGVAEALGFGESLPECSWVTQQVDGWVLERKWQLNRFLEKWLEYCLVCGHRFAGAHGARA